MNFWKTTQAFPETTLKFPLFIPLPVQIWVKCRRQFEFNSHVASKRPFPLPLHCRCCIQPPHKLVNSMKKRSNYIALNCPISCHPFIIDERVPKYFIPHLKLSTRYKKTETPIEKNGTRTHLESFIIHCHSFRC
jgi:hypothetical protein